MDAFIESVFGKLSNYNPEALNRQFLHRAILTPKNVHVTELNESAMEKLKGDFHAPYKAIDTLELESQNCNYPKEWLQKLQINLKLGAPIMVLRNIDPFNGVCNGTNGIITAMEKHVIQMAILSNDNDGDGDDVKHVFIPRISLIPSDPQIPVQFKRHQFPIRVAFAMTINKSQGQTLEKVGIYLPETAFGHGQLYVAFSRIWDFANITMFLKEAEDQEEGKGVWYTKNEVYQEMLTSVHSVAVEDVPYLQDYYSPEPSDTDEDYDMSSIDEIVGYVSSSDESGDSDDEAVFDDEIF